MSPSAQAKAALRQAEAEGLTLLKSGSSSTGYKGVTFTGGRNLAKPYQVKVWRGGTKVSLGYFTTPEEAALCYARSPEGRAAAAAPPEPPPLTAEEALRQAEAEGLTLLKSERSSTGYKNVSFRTGKTKPYQARVTRDGKELTLGFFLTAEEAALSIARSPEGREAAAAPPKPPPMTAEEALQQVMRQVEAEGLTLPRSGRNSTGFRGVTSVSKNSSKPYAAKAYRGGKLVYLGRFTTPEEAALCYARSPEGQEAAAAPPAPPPLTAEEVLRQAQAKGLTLLRSESSSTGYRGVRLKGSRNLAKPYQAEVRRGGMKVTLGYYPTPEEAALRIARDSAAQAAAPQPPAASSRKRKVKSEEQPPDMPVDVVVILDGRLVDDGAYTVLFS